MCGFVGVLLNEGFIFNQEYTVDIQKAHELIGHRSSYRKLYVDDPHMSLVYGGLNERKQARSIFQGSRYTVVMDGKIYNESYLRDVYGKTMDSLSNQSIAEFIAHLFHLEGTRLFSLLHGTYTLMIWEKVEKTLYGVRDQFGKKPLYYKENEMEFIFASEKKSITYLTDELLINEEALQQYLSFQYVPSPLTMTEGIKKLSPGYFFMKRWEQPVELYQYIKPSFRPYNRTSEIQMVERIQEVLFDSIGTHLPKHGTVGSFLSGGIDSSFIAAIAREKRPDIKTFSVGFMESGYSEVELAKRTADALNIDNISYMVSAEEYVEHIPEVIWHMDDPLADPSCISLFIGAKEAKKHVDVILSGEGADELFGGYNIYREPNSLRFVTQLPDAILQMFLRIANIIPDGVRGKSFMERAATPLHKRYIGNAKIFEEQQKQLFLKTFHVNYSYEEWTKPFYQDAKDYHPAEQMQYIDLNTWLPGNILLKADKMSMAHGLDLRMPFLDEEVFEVARRIPVDKKIANGTTKAILRKSAIGIVPNHVIYQKKLGFPVPINQWLKHEMYGWAIDLIEKSDTDYLFDKSYIKDLLHHHRSSRLDHSRKIWTVLMFMVWHQIYMEKAYSFIDFPNEQARETLSLLPY
ncbi:asparagine synthase (glutamine-hydrolyzing) [Virgibacillus soli]|uniref:asparagine synthase (glutamine-hydrolyzing) n=1 Tax=Paracerasibacillus soli TaxID=480284 RepID=UPI0035E806E7